MYRRERTYREEKVLRKNKRTGPNKDSTGEKLDLKKINVHVRLFGS